MRNVGFEILGFTGVLAAAATGVFGLSPSPAQACGGLFCSSANPVNQAAEQIVFVDHPDDTVTAIIEIMYEGPAHEFAWVLPVPGVPDVGVSSAQALDVIQQATNPVYSLQTTFNGSCGGPLGASRGANDSASGAAGGGPGESGVVVEASGAVGPYVYEVISLDESLEDAAAAAVAWLTDNEYEIGDLGADVLRPYLLERMNLIAFKLSKGNDAGSIRPIMIKYESELPSIPIRPTAVAANENMGVMVWVLAEERAVPENYKHLVLNEALLDWFTPMSNYNEVVIRAADEAMGHGFVTEYAGEHAQLGISVFSEGERSEWDTFMQGDHQDAAMMVLEAMQRWRNRDGFDEALRAAVTLPENIAFEDFQNCLQCYAAQEGVMLDGAEFLQQLYEMVIKPLVDTQALLDGNRYMTRLYTTLSPEEMTTDPIFALNPDLADISNFHVAEQVMDCEGEGWRVNLPQGDTVRGFEAGVWPVEVDDAPAALKILQLGTQGQGRVVDDRSRIVDSMIAARNQQTTSDAEDAGLIERKGGCSAAPGNGPASAGALLLLALAGLLRRRARA